MLPGSASLSCRSTSAATRNRWMLRRSGRTKTTRPALGLAGDPLGLWRATTATVGRSDPFSSVLSELIALRLLEGPATTISLDRMDELTQAVAPTLLAQGWRQGATPVDERYVSHALHESLGEWRVFGLLEKRRPWRPGDDDESRFTVSLNEAGRFAALAHLFARATAPRHEIFD